MKTPDERYLVVEGKAGPRLWRAANPGLTDDARTLWISRLMDARRALKTADINPDERTVVRRNVDEAKRALGERGAPWWTDGTPDLNRVLVKNSPYRDWWSQLVR